MLTLGASRGLVVLDEIQRLPEIFPVLRVLIDRVRPATRFLVLGSASPALLKQSSESLAGRISYHEMQGFDLEELGSKNMEHLWLRGAFPRSFLARSDKASLRWRNDFIRTFIERDIPQLGFHIPATTLRSMWTMLAHYHGQTCNLSEFARSFGVSHAKIRHYLDVLASTYAIQLLRPYHENIKKRQVKSPKVYLSDSGLLHALLGLKSKRDLEGHPKVGASWEGFALTQVRARLRAPSDACFFWATHADAEIDLIVVKGLEKTGFEFKRTSSPKLMKSMHIAMQDLNLKRLYVIHAGQHKFKLDKNVEAIPIEQVITALKPMF